MQINALPAQLATRFWIGGQRTAALGLEEIRKVSRPNVAWLAQRVLRSPSRKTVQEKFIGPLGMLRLAAFMANMLQEFLNVRIHAVPLETIFGFVKGSVFASFCHGVELSDNRTRQLIPVEMLLGVESRAGPVDGRYRATTVR